MADYPRVPFDLDGYVASISETPCFICRVASGEDVEHEIVLRDDRHLAFFNKFPSLLGHTLVAPIDHREGVVQDFTEDEYVGLQRFSIDSEKPWSRCCQQNGCTCSASGVSKAIAMCTGTWRRCRLVCPSSSNN
jgi:hypothetical protein